MRPERQAWILLGGQCPQGIGDAPLQQRADRARQVPPDQRLRGVSYGDRPVHERACVTITGHRTSVAFVALIGELVEVKDRSQGLAPEFATPDMVYSQYLVSLKLPDVFLLGRVLIESFIEATPLKPESYPRFGGELVSAMVFG